MMSTRETAFVLLKCQVFIVTGVNVVCVLLITPNIVLITFVTCCQNMLYSNQEYADMHFLYGFCNGSALAARREYQRRYPQRRIPNVRVFSNVHRFVLNLLIKKKLNIKNL